MDDYSFVVVISGCMTVWKLTHIMSASWLVRGRVQLRQDFPGDAALVMTDLQLNDTGRYRCEVVDGLEDKSSLVHLELRGTICPATLTTWLKFSEWDQTLDPTIVMNSSTQVWCSPTSTLMAITTWASWEPSRPVRSRTPHWPPSRSSSSPGRRAWTGAMQAGWQTGQSSTPSPNPECHAGGTASPRVSGATAEDTSSFIATMSSASRLQSEVRQPFCK